MKLINCYCIKDYYFYDKRLFKKGESYIMQYENPPDTIWVIYNIDGGYDSTGFRFRTKNIEHYVYEDLDKFDDYFCSVKEYRKLKIEKINNFISN